VINKRAVFIYQLAGSRWRVETMSDIPSFEECYHTGIVIYKSEALAFAFAEEIAFTLEHETLPLYSMFDVFEIEDDAFLWECRGWH